MNSNPRVGSRVAPADFQALDLRAHELLRDVPIHDVWCLPLPRGGKSRTIDDVRALMSAERLSEVNPIVRFLFRLRGALGRVFGWDAPEPGAAGGPPPKSFVHRLTDDDRNRSRVAPGTSDGPFRVLYVHGDEAVSEIENATVHAFSVLALRPRDGDYDLYWAIYVIPVGRITAFYMALIDPFRRFIVYPAVLRHVHRAWCERTDESPA